VKLAFIYALLALIATGINIGAQGLAVRTYSGPYAVLLSMAIGTVAGLLVKYALDKQYIFRFRARDAAHDGQTFILYSIMGLATTAIFWGIELLFDHLFATATMRYMGAFIGLAIGYLAKYHLDKRYVFRTAVGSPRAPEDPLRPSH
jgi:short subunit fatty acids transporter